MKFGNSNLGILCPRFEKSKIKLTRSKYSRQTRHAGGEQGGVPKFTPFTEKVFFTAFSPLSAESLEYQSLCTYSEHQKQTRYLTHCTAYIVPSMYTRAQNVWSGWSVYDVLKCSCSRGQESGRKGCHSHDIFNI